MEKTEAIQIADEILTLYKMYGNQDYIGEPVSQIEHMCQCAQLAESENYDHEVILAAFFHDIGMSPEEKEVLIWRKVWDDEPEFENAEEQKI